MGVNHCPNKTVIDEEELLNAIKIYLKNIIKNKKDFMKAVEKEFNKTIKTVDDILNNQTITNAMLKTIIDVIEVDSDSNVEVRLKLLNEIGTNEPVITKFEDIYKSVEEKESTKNKENSTALKSNNSTQRCIRKTKENKSKFGKRSKSNPR